ncbi:sortase [Candidatus Gottesmanbacteria bacterium]|nr:sortase [Candidatus Gottesmanbacteria bacterium]MBI5452166.1 sortase [Candidatus Gottesmanbacteria bacterium]
MALYSYVKIRSTVKRRIAEILSVIFIFSGISLLSWVLFPIISFELYYAPKFNNLIKPIPAEIIKNTITNSLPAVLGVENADYTKASVWFPKAQNLKLASTNTSYTLSIPKLGIEKANVLVGGEDLSKSLIHFTGPLPGNFGNPVIFGHSTLLWFYNPKDYKSIFSKLPELDINDEILVDVDNVTYKYQVYEMKVVSPDNLSVLEQNYDNAYITLVTCVPPGTYFRRLIVRGKLVTI